MIQRIQSVFLFISLCFLIPMFFVPVAELSGTPGEPGNSGVVFTFNLTGFYQSGPAGNVQVSSQYSILAFGILISALNLVTIFMYKRRILQMRLCIYNMLLLAGLFGVMLFVLHGLPQIQSVSYRIPFVFPFISVILHYLAFRGIRRDELMIQALSRLR